MIQNIKPSFFINFQGRKPKYTQKQKELAMRFADVGLTPEDVEKMSIKYPKLNYGSAYTNEYNVREFVKLFEQEGLTVEQHMEAVKKQPSLFASKPETLSKSINDLYNFASRYGVTKKGILELQAKNPVLRAMSAETLIYNMTEIPRCYKKSGLTEEEYVKMAFSDVYLISVTPERFIGNINSIIEYYQDLGITEKDLIKTFKKQRMIATSITKKIIEKIDCWKFIEENKLSDSNKKMKKKDFKELLLRKNLSHSVESNLMYLLRCKLNTYFGTNIPSKNFKEILVKFISQNSDKIIEIPILKGAFLNTFEEVVSNFSKSIVGKNIFKIAIK